jgi:uncharacterized repeat protein (TIGR01451 family)
MFRRVLSGRTGLFVSLLVIGIILLMNQKSSSSAAVAGQTIINFDDIDTSVTLTAPLTDQYKSQGVLFSEFNPNDGTTSPEAVVRDGFSGNGAFSLPNSAAFGFQGRIAKVTFVDPVTGGPAVTDFVSAQVGDRSDEVDPITMTAFDINDHIVGTSSFTSVSTGSFGLVNISASGIHRVEFTDTDPSGANFDDLTFNPPVANCTPPPSGMVAWLPGDGNANDIVSGNSGRLVNGATFGPGKVDQGFSLDGVDDYVDIGELTQLQNAQEITVMAWIKKSDLNNPFSGIVGKWNTTPFTNNTFLLYNGESTFMHKGAFVIQLDNGAFVGATGSTDLPVNEWVHVAATWRSSDGFIAIYKNGVLDGSANGGVGGTLNFHTDYTAKIGEWGIVRDSFYKFKGGIDEVQIFTRALSQAEIQSIVNSGSAGQCKVVQPAKADLAITQTDSPDPVTVGNNLIYKLTITNNGPSAATGVTLIDTPLGANFLASSQNCPLSASVNTCNLGNLAAGASVTVSIAVTPTAAGTVSNTASVTATEVDPNTANNSATESTTVISLLPLQIAPITATVAAGATQTFTASGGKPPYTFSILTSNSGGAINSSGLYKAGARSGVTDTVRVRDVNGATSDASVTVVAAAAPKLVFKVQPSSTTAGNAISPAVEVSIQDQFGNIVTTANNAVGIAIGANPSGGTLSGTTSANAVNGVAIFSNLSINTAGNGYTLSATSSGLTSATSTAFNIGCPAITVSPATLPSGTMGIAYSQTLTASGGSSGSFSFAITSGALPSGMNLSSSGLLSGTPGGPGNFNFTITATDNNLCTGSRSYTLVINCPLITLSPATLPNGTINVSYSQSITASNGTPPFRFAITAGALPQGLSLSTSGLIFGTPTAVGSFKFTATATDAFGCTGTRIYQLTIVCPTITLSIPSSGAPVSGEVGTAYSQTITASGGRSPFSFAVTAGALPNGLTLSSAGTISGTPGTPGYFKFTVTATDVDGCTGSRTTAITVIALSACVPSFSTNSFITGTTPIHAATADFNSDGRLDLAIANQNSNNVSILRGDGAGGFGAPTNFPVGNGPRYLVVGDFNRDGRSDLAVANFGSNNISILLGTGTGSFGLPTNLSAASPRSLAVGDFNSDGRSDLAVLNSNGIFNGTVSLLLGTGTGSFTSGTSASVGAATSMIAADLNRDGRLDLAMTNGGSNVSILLGTGTGSFSPPTNFSVGSNPVSITVGDFNRDGNPDLAVLNSNSSSSTVSLLLGTGTGSFTPARNYPAGVFDRNLETGDFNQDGKLDLAVSSPALPTSDILILLGDGVGGFVAPKSFTADSPQFVLVRDFNGDGKPDMASLSGNNFVSILLNICQ